MYITSKVEELVGGWHEASASAIDASAGIRLTITGQGVYSDIDKAEAGARALKTWMEGCGVLEDVLREAGQAKREAQESPDKRGERLAVELRKHLLKQDRIVGFDYAVTYYYDEPTRVMNLYVTVLGNPSEYLRTHVNNILKAWGHTANVTVWLQT